MRSRYPGTSVVTNLLGDRQKAVDIVANMRAQDPKIVVAIGLLAAQAARQQLNNKQVIFCQVLNYDDFSLITPWMTGVSAIPSLEKQFYYWKLLNPKLKRIAMFTSEHMARVVTEALRIAHKHGLELLHREVSASRELIPAFAQLSKEVQGLWLAPDSSILSSQTINEVLIQAIKSEVQVLAFSPTLLKNGATLSAIADEEEIVAALMMRIREIETNGSFTQTSVTPLTKAKIKINERMTDQLTRDMSSRIWIDNDGYLQAQ
ncbi:MAG: ABC transporter substrate binding protein [Pseudomonadota bacterium]